MVGRMKQRSSSSSKNNNNVKYYSSDEEEEEEDSDFEIEEYEVAEILCQLPQLILRSDQLCYLLNLTWGSKKIRTALISSSSSDSPSPPSSVFTTTTHQPPPFPVLTYQNSEEEEEVIFKVKKKDTSPDTPLTFYHTSESDSKKKTLKRKKKTKEEWEDYLMKVTDQNNTFKKEVDKVKQHYQNLLAQNLKIKAIKARLEQLSNCSQIDLNSSKGGSNLHLLVESERPTTSSSAPDHQQSNMVIYEQPPPNHQKGSEIFENSRYPHSQMPTTSSPAGTGLTMAQQFGSMGLFDLNSTADHETTSTPSNSTCSTPTDTGFAATSRSKMGFCQPFDLRKAVLTAEARRKRYEMTKVKKSMANAKTRLQIR